MGELSLESWSHIATIVGIGVAILTLWWTQKEARADRNLDLLINLSQSSRERWENEWDEALQRFEDPDGRATDMDRRQLAFMPNWVDWLGTLVRMEVLQRDDVLLAGLRFAFARVLTAGRTTIERDVGEHGRQYWQGALCMGEKLELGWTDRGALPGRTP